MSKRVKLILSLPPIASHPNTRQIRCVIDGEDIVAYKSVPGIGCAVKFPDGYVAFVMAEEIEEYE